MCNKHLISIGVLLFFISILSAQNCLPGGIRFERQTQLDSFSILYPGCTVIEGDVCIGDCQDFEASDITNLDGLAQLTSIKGKLIISRNPLLTSIQGLQNLLVMENDLVISWNDLLPSLEGLDQLRLIKGSFTLEFNAGMDTITGFEMLDTIIGTLTMTYLWNLSSVAAFSNLKYLGGYNINGLGKLVAIPDMNNLSYLGDFTLEYNAELTELPQFPLLSRIDGNFIVNGNFKLPVVQGYENINRVTGDLIIDASGGELHREVEAFNLNAFHHLTFVGGRFSIYVELLDTLDGFTLLDSVGGGFSVNASNGFHTFPQDNQFNFIGGEIYLISLPLLEGLECLSMLEHINGLALGSCPNLMNLSAVSHFTEFGGGLELIQLNLTGLSDLSSLNTIGGSLRIYDCNSLTNLTGLEGLTSIDGHIFIFRNMNLESLEGIQNINPQTIQSTGNEAIIITDNPRLSICNVESICEALRGLRKSYRIENNALGCDNISQLECKSYGLNGIAFLDINQNQVPDTNETGIPGIPITVEPGNTIVFSNSQGRFFVFADSGDVYTMTIAHNSDWILTTDSVSYTTTFQEGSPENDDHIFGLIPAFDWYDLSVDLTSNPVRCNQDVHFFLHWLNGSTSPVDGRIVLRYDSIVTYVSSIVPPNSHNAGTRELTWDIDSLALFTGQDVRITFKLANETYVGQTMEFIARSFIDSSGTEVLMDMVEYSPILVCAYDPNDKQVMPVGIQNENYTLKDDPLTYTIRFENLGNAEAIDITIFDTLDASLDMGSFRVINSSYPVFTSIDGHEVTFRFLNIWLPEMERGFVTYEVRPRSDVPDLTLVENSAGIVFDFNEPIITNTTFNTLVYEICEDVTHVIDTVVCQGEDYLGYTETGVYYDTVQIGSICDSFSEIHLTVFEPEIIHMDTSICEGESFHGFDSTGVYTYDSINLVTGCMDMVELNLEVIPLGTGECITGINTIQEKGYKVYPNPAQNELFIEASKTIESVSLYTVQWRKVDLMETTVTGTQAHIQWYNSIPDGIYILIIRESDRISFEKIILCK